MRSEGAAGAWPRARASGKEVTMTLQACEHFSNLEPVRPSAEGCEDCLRIGGAWVHLRMCLRCGHMGCCESSPHRHATAHFHSTLHPAVRSMQPGEDWGWCYEDEIFVEEVPA
jgi:uncharacterized UBP type Zn finger protein